MVYYNDLAHSIIEVGLRKLEEEASHKYDARLREIEEYLKSIENMFTRLYTRQDIILRKLDELNSKDKQVHLDLED